MSKIKKTRKVIMDYRSHRNQMTKLIQGLEILMNDTMQIHNKSLHFFKEEVRDKESSIIRESIISRKK